MTYNRNPYRDARDGYREAAERRAAVELPRKAAPPLPGANARSPRRSQQGRDGDVRTRGGSGQGSRSPGHSLGPRGRLPGADDGPRGVAARSDSRETLLSTPAKEVWIHEGGRHVRLGPPESLGPISATDRAAGEHWGDFLAQQNAALAAIKAKEERASGSGDRVPRGESLHHETPLPADVPAGADRPAKPKGEPSGELPWPLFGAAAAPGPGPVVIDPYMPEPMDEDLPDLDGFLGEDAAASGATTPLWPPPDATLADLGVWLDSLRSLPPDDAQHHRCAFRSHRARGFGGAC